MLVGFSISRVRLGVPSGPGFFFVRQASSADVSNDSECPEGDNQFDDALNTVPKCVADIRAGNSTPRHGHGVE